MTLPLDELQEARRFFQSTLDALSAHIAILDESGTILAVNEAWRRFAANNRFGQADAGVGANYLAVCEAASGDQANEAHAVVRGIREIIAKQRTDFYLEYPCHGPMGQRWFFVRVTRFRDMEPVRIVVAHEDITERKLAEEAARRAQDVLSRTNAELEDKVAELERFEDVVVGRELKMIDLEREVRKLKAELEECRAAQARIARQSSQ
jgi:PAS domain S-box-containing protein